MKSVLTISVWLVAFSVFGQSLSESQQKAINSYIQLSNHLTSQVSAIGPSLVRMYKESAQYTNSPMRQIYPYTCRLETSSYYFDDVKKTAGMLGTSGAGVASKSLALQQIYQKIDETCKAIEIYYRLKDYETDRFEKCRILLNDLQKQVATYHSHLKDLHLEIERLVAVLQPYQPSSPYHKAAKLMREQLVFERELLQSWTFNLAQEIHTGWPSEKTQQHVLDNLKRIETLNQTKPAVQYPASSQYSAFVENIEALQKTKRAAVNEYTYEEQQSDAYSNRVYENLINYYNGAAVSFYNNFINMANQNGYRGIYYLTYPLQFDIRTEVKLITIDVTPYTDKPALPISVAPVNTAIPPNVFNALTNYVDFINEGVRQINNMMNSIGALNGDASNGKANMKARKTVIINYHYKNFQVPVTLYQQTVSQTKAIPSPYQKSLLSNAEVLYSILNEINQWSNVLLADAATKQLTKDSLDHVYKIVRRYKLLTDVFDQRKEVLYTDVRKIAESYKVINPSSSWVVSGKALRALLDEDLKELLTTKRILLGDSTVKQNPEMIIKLSRDAITNEYTNMAGIQKLGRYNGLCPYTPYEDLPKVSIEFVDILKKWVSSESVYGRHPYNEILYYYNQLLVRYYNDFAKLAKVPLLKSVIQVEHYEVMEPKKPAPPKPVEPVVVQTTPTIYIPEPEETQSESVAKNLPTAKQKKEKDKREKVVRSETEQVKGAVIHDTVRITDIIRIETVRKDTVYISKVDTVYVGMQGDNLSMEGYATNNMVLLLDVSGSMNAPEKLPLLKKSVLLLMKMMREEDQVSIVTYSGKAKVELQPTSFKEEDKITKVIERLKSEGNTDGIAGIKLAYQVADKNYKRGGNNRIILATDGEFPISKDVYELVEKFASEDIFITVFNFGKNTVATKNLQQLVTKGRGNYEYITRENVDTKLVREAKAKKRK